MEITDDSSNEGHSKSGRGEVRTGESGRGRRRAPLIYTISEFLTAAILAAMLVLSPWAFGGLHAGTIAFMNFGCYVIGVLLGIKWMVRKISGFKPATWVSGKEGDDESKGKVGFGARVADWRVLGMALLTVGVLVYCLVSALNARAVYLWGEARFVYRDCLLWLPHSYDGPRSWLGIWKYLGWVCLFWGIRDWVIGKTWKERRGLIEIWRRDGGGTPGEYYVPERLRLLLWMICISGGSLAVLGIAQRLSGTDRIFWLLRPDWPRADFLFSVFSYRGNAADYFNLLWPICGIFGWLVLRFAQRARENGGREKLWPGWLLIVIAMVMAACPAMAGSRGGTIVAAVMLALVLIALSLASRRRARSVVMTGVIALVLMVGLGWQQVQPRFGDLMTNGLSSRVKLSGIAAAVARDNFVFGTGPETYPAVSQLYFADPMEEWYVQAHDDWMQGLATMGGVGFALVAALLMMTFLPGIKAGGMAIPSVLRWGMLIAAGGCLAHAKFDFPFQIHSIATLFVVLCALISIVVGCGQRIKKAANGRTLSRLDAQSNSTV